MTDPILDYGRRCMELVGQHVAMIQSRLNSWPLEFPRVAVEEIRDSAKVVLRELATIAPPASGSGEARTSSGGTERELAAVEVLRELFGFLDSGYLVRDISHDHEPGWAMRQLPFVSTLAKGKQILDGSTPASLPDVQGEDAEQRTAGRCDNYSPSTEGAFCARCGSDASAHGEFYR